MSLFRGLIPSLSFTLHNDVDTKGEQMIYLRYRIAGAYKFRTTGFKIRPEYWDAKMQRMKSDAPGAERVNKRLERIMNVARGAFLEYEGPLTSARLDELLDKTYVCERDYAFITPFDEYAAGINDKRFNEGKLQYRAWYDKKNFIVAFERYANVFLGKRPYFLNEICASDLEGYISYRRQMLGNTSDELIVKSMQPILVAIEAACSEGLTSERNMKECRAVYDDFREPLPPPGQEKQEFLSMDDIVALDKYLDESTDWKYFEAVSVFLFSYYACGMKFSDILTLRWEDVAGSYIFRRSPRTGVPTAILPPITGKVRRILNQWEGRYPQYVFGMLDDTVDTKALIRLDALRVTKNNELNRNLRHLGRILGINRNLTISTARDSFVAHALSDGLSLYTVSKLLGHNSLDETARQYRKLMIKSVEKDVEVLLNT